MFVEVKRVSIWSSTQIKTKSSCALSVLWHDPNNHKAMTEGEHLLRYLEQLVENRQKGPLL